MNRTCFQVQRQAVKRAEPILPFFPPAARTCMARGPKQNNPNLVRLFLSENMSPHLLDRMMVLMLTVSLLHSRMILALGILVIRSAANKLEY
jgi:hypothetical protein